MSFIIWRKLGFLSTQQRSWMLGIFSTQCLTGRFWVCDTLDLEFKGRLLNSATWHWNFPPTADSYQRYNALPSCFTCERKHKTISGYATCTRPPTLNDPFWSKWCAMRFAHWIWQVAFQAQLSDEGSRIASFVERFGSPSCQRTTRSVSYAVVQHVLLPRKIENMQPTHSKAGLSWANYNDVSRGHPKWWFNKGTSPKSLNSGLGIILICPDCLNQISIHTRLVRPI